MPRAGLVLAVVRSRDGWMGTKGRGSSTLAITPFVPCVFISMCDMYEIDLIIRRGIDDEYECGSAPLSHVLRPHPDPLVLPPSVVDEC